MWGQDKIIKTAAVAWLLVGVVGLAACGNDGEIDVRPAPSAGVAPSPTVPPSQG